VAADGETYERRAIQRWLFEPVEGFPKGHFTSPVTRDRLPHRELVANNIAARAVAARCRAVELLEARADQANLPFLGDAATAVPASLTRALLLADERQPFENIPFDDIKVGDTLQGGRGVPGETTVVKGSWSGQRVALTFRWGGGVAPGGASSGPYLSAKSAALLWRLRTHPNIVDFIGVSVNRTHEGSTALPIPLASSSSPLAPETTISHFSSPSSVHISLLCSALTLPFSHPPQSARYWSQNSSPRGISPAFSEARRRAV